MRQNLVNFIVHKIIPKLVLYSLRLKLSKITSLKIISSAEFYKVVNQFFRKFELSKVLDTFLEVIQNPLNKFEKFQKIS